MGRGGRGRGRGRGRGGGRGDRKGGRLSARERRDLRELGERHPVHDEDGDAAAYRSHDVRPNKRARKEGRRQEALTIAQRGPQPMLEGEDGEGGDGDSEEEADAPDAYSRLLHSFGVAVDGEGSSSSSEEEGGEGEGEDAVLELGAEALAARQAELGDGFELVPVGDDGAPLSDGQEEEEGMVAEEEEGDDEVEESEEEEAGGDPEGEAGLVIEDRPNARSNGGGASDLRRAHFSLPAEHSDAFEGALEGLGRQTWSGEPRPSACFGQAEHTVVDPAVAAARPAHEAEARRAALEGRRADIKARLQVEYHGGSVALPAAAKELFGHLNAYRDVLLPLRTHSNGEELRAAYALHTLNHVLRKRTEVLKNNVRLAQASEGGGEEPEVQDMGFARCAVLVLVPYRYCAFQVVNALSALVTGKGTAAKKTVKNLKRFLEEYDAPAVQQEHPNEEHRRVFCGNVDDRFFIGLNINRSTLNLYTNFYKSDIIIASPLGLRMQIGGEGDKEREFDFLASVEVCIIDQIESMLMQNWAHVLHCVEHLNQIPTAPRDTDMSRVKPYALEGWAKYFRQTVCIARYATPELVAFFNRKCLNHGGKVKFSREHEGVVHTIASKVPQTFQRLPRTTVKGLADARFRLFVEEVLPERRSGLLAGRTLVFVPSYFDFVRLRNHFKLEGIVFGQICEYTSSANVSRTRSHFYHGTTPFLLYTERYHYHFRPRLRGIQHLIFYGLPLNADMYAELLNSVTRADATCTVLYSALDALALERVVGTRRAQRIASAAGSTHLLI